MSFRKATKPDLTKYSTIAERKHSPEADAAC